MNNLVLLKSELHPYEWNIVVKNLYPSAEDDEYSDCVFYPRITHNGGLAIDMNKRCLGLDFENSVRATCYDTEKLRREIDTVLESAYCKKTANVWRAHTTLMLHHFDDGIGYCEECPDDFNLSGQTILLVNDIELVKGLEILGNSRFIELAKLGHTFYTGYIGYQFYQNQVIGLGTFHYSFDEAYLTLMTQYSNYLTPQELPKDPLSWFIRDRVPSDQILDNSSEIEKAAVQEFEEHCECIYEQDIPDEIRTEINQRLLDWLLYEIDPEMLCRNIEPFFSNDPKLLAANLRADSENTAA